MSERPKTKELPVIHYTESVEDLGPEKLRGFFVGWPNKPSPETHLELLKKSSYRVLALNEKGEVVGFVTAISDGVLSAYIPFLEVLPDYQAQGIGQELMGKMLEKLKNLYMVDLMCDPSVQPFYARMGMKEGTGMMLRNFPKQNGAGE
ncbi:GNAT family N-acetyltransferase [Patescibacteria group bacterium]|nr:GNAT family N-acetyltransferase [Patescibacteria group bacterium]